jgi:Family of unknown function (DUF5670)
LLRPLEFWLASLEPDLGVLLPCRLGCGLDGPGLVTPPARPIWSAVHQDVPGSVPHAANLPADGMRRFGSARELEVEMLWTVVVVLLILWLLGFSLHIGGALIHLLLVVGLVVLVINLLSGRSG